MKKLDKAALQMQKLAGIITESEYNTEMAKMNNTPKMEAEDANMNTYKVERVGPTHTEEMVESPLNIADFSKEMLDNYKAEGLTDEFAFARPEASLGVENSSDWMVSISEDLAYAISQVDSAASMNEMNKMKRTPKMEAEGSEGTSSQMEDGIGLPYDDGMMAKAFIKAATKLGLEQGTWNNGNANGDYSFDYERGDAREENEMVNANGENSEGNNPSTIFILNSEMQNHPTVKSLVQKCMEEYQ